MVSGKSLSFFPSLFESLFLILLFTFSPFLHPPLAVLDIWSYDTGLELAMYKASLVLELVILQNLEITGTPVPVISVNLIFYSLSCFN